MLETITKTDLIELMQDMGPHCWWVYSAMAALAEDGECNLTQEELAGRLGVSERSVRRYINQLSKYQVNGQRLVSAARKFESNVYHVVPLRVVPDTAGSKREITKARATATDEVWQYWLTKYEERYGFRYKAANFGKDKGCLKRLVERYEGNTELLKQIIDVVMRLYDSRWKTRQFLRPTIGQLSSWLAAQAEPFVQVSSQSSQPEESEPETPGEEVDLLDLIDRKWG